MGSEFKSLDSGVFMAESPSVGRPHVYKEPLIKRNFDLPVSLNERLKEHSAKTDKAAVRIVQDALERVLPPIDGSAPSMSEGSATASDVDFQDLITGLRHDMRAVFTDVFHSVPVSVNKARRGKLQDLAEELGFANVEDLLQELAFRATESPKSAASFLFSQYEESAVVAAQTDAHKAKNASRRSKSQKSA